MTIRHLRIFVEVAQSGSMSSAASKLYMTQPSVSQAIKELEAHYDVLLFERLSKRLYITEAGRHLLSYARQVLAQFDVLEESMQKESRTETLRIGATVTVGGSILSDILKDFHKSCPLVQTSACVSNTRIIEEKIANMELDVGLIEGTVKHKDLVAIPVIDDQLILAVCAQHPFAGLKTLPIKRLSGQNFAMRETGSGTRELFESFLKKHHISIHTALEATTPDAIRNAVLVNQYMTVISARLMSAELKNGLIYMFVNQNDEWKRSFSFVYHKDKLLSASIHRLKAIAKTYNRDQFAGSIPFGKLTQPLRLPSELR